MDFKVIFKDFNARYFPAIAFHMIALAIAFHASKFLCFICFLPLSILISLKLHGSIDWSIWVIFIPIWLLDILIISGAIIGIVVWFFRSDHRTEREPLTDYKAMLITFGIHVLLLMFEGLLCDNIESEGQNMWLVVFSPLFLSFPVSVAACIWGIRNDRSLELEMVISINILFFIFVALRLDQILMWPWAAVFVPMWIIMSLPCVASLYYLIWSLIFFRSNFPRSDRQSHLYMAVLWIVIVITFLTFLVLVVYKLDGVHNHSWLLVFLPLHLTIVAFILATFGSKNGNRWWFGLRTDFCQFLLEHCTCLRLYGNVSFKGQREEHDMEQQEQFATNTHIFGAALRTDDVNITSSLKYEPVVAVECIESPD